MAISLVQAAFNSGEISPSLYARTNIDRYQSAAKIIENFGVRTHGGLEKRPGSFFVDPVYDNAYPSRLKKFQFSATQGYGLEFSNKKMRVIYKGGLVLKPKPEDNPDAEDEVYELDTEYDIDEVWQMKFVQSADVVFITHPSHTPRMLKRYDHNNWELEDMVFVPQVSTPTNVILSAAVVGSNTYKYRVTAISDKTGEESLPATASVTSAAISSTNTVKISWDRVEGCKKYSVYRYSSGMYGWISTFVDDDEDGVIEVIDDNTKPNFDITPPTERNPFNGENNYPSCCGLYEQRMPMGATYNDFELIEISKSANYNNFTMSNPLQDDDAISIRAAGEKVNTIYHFLPLEELLALTANGIWKVSSSGETKFLSPKSAKAKQQNVYVCDDLEPIVIGNTALFMADGKVRTLGYMLEADGYDGNEISIFASHLFDNRQVICWDYCSTTSQIWMVFADGQMATLTFVKEHQLYAFTRYTTNGWFESVCSVRHDNEEVVYAVVMREVNGNAKRYIEKFIVSQKVTSSNDDFLFMDCSSQLISEEPITKISGLDYLEGVKVGVVGDGSYIDKYIVQDGIIELTIPVKKVEIGIVYEANLRTLNIDYPVSQITSSSQGYYKKLPAINVYVENSGMFKVAVVEDANNDFSSSTLEYTNYGKGPKLLTGYERVDLSGGYTLNGEIIIKSDIPMPLTINAIIPEVVHGG